MSFIESDTDSYNADSPNESSKSAATALRVLKYIGLQLTQVPDRVVVQEVFESDDKVRLTLLVDKADMGRVIGRHGKIAGSIRAVVRAAAAKDGVDASIEIQERLA